MLARALELFRRAGHDADDVDIFRVDALLLRPIGLDRRAEHLHGRLAGGEIGDQLGIVVLDKTDPAGRAAGEHGERAPLLDAVDQLVRLFHNGEVRGEVDVEHLVKAEHAHGGEHLALGIGADGVAEFLADGGAHGGSRRDDDDLFGIVDGGAHVVDLFALVQGARRADGDALAAGDAGRLAQVRIERTGDVRMESAAGRRNDGDLLHALAHRDAAAAEDALFVVAHEIAGGGILLVLGLFALEAVLVAAVLVGELLQFAVGGADAGEALLFMVGEQQLERGLARLAHFFGIGEYLHALVDGVHAGGDQRTGALHLANADAAGADLVDVFEIAEGGDVDADRFGGFENGAPLRDLHRNIVDFQMYHD